MPLSIWHLDLDSFFVSAERLRNPALRGKPMAVGGNGPRSVISSASYEARPFGVRSALPTSVALRLCPKLILVKPDGKYYSRLSHEVFSLLPEYTPIFEQVGVDEAYLDMTGSENIFGPPKVAAEKLRAAIFKKTGLTASIGIASNRMVAKIASDVGKPNGVCFVEPGTEKAFLAPMAVEKIPGCGKATTKWLHERGIRLIADIQRYPVEILEKHLGEYGGWLHRKSQGLGSTTFNREAANPGISREMTYDQDVIDLETLEKDFWWMATKLGRELREEGHFCRTVKLKLRYPPFETISRQSTLPHPTNLDKDLFDAAMKLFKTHWDRRPIRLIGMGCKIEFEGTRQFGLFEDVEGEVKREKLDQLRDEVRNRFGKNSIKTGRDL